MFGKNWHRNRASLDQLKLENNVDLKQELDDKLAIMPPPEEDKKKQKKRKNYRCEKTV